MNTRVFRALNATLNPNVVPACEKFERLSDAFWGCLARHYSQTIYHPSGTLMMGPRSNRNNLQLNFSPLLELTTINFFFF